MRSGSSIHTEDAPLGSGEGAARWGRAPGAAPPSVQRPASWGTRRVGGVGPRSGPAASWWGGPAGLGAAGRELGPRNPSLP